ncbi:MAG: hypothetical protein ACI867_000558 [Glaciecola sp.]|jgi:hypothetical protein
MARGDTMATFDDQLEGLGFRAQGRSRKGGLMWALPFNRHLKFMLHDYTEHVIFTWSFQAGEYFLERGWVLGAGETTFQELYPQSDVRLATDIKAVRAEITRVLSTLRFDLGTIEL